MKAECGNDFWLGVDLAQETLDTSIAQVGTALAAWKTLPAEHFQHSRPFVRNMLAWVRRQLPKDARIQGICVESTGRLSHRFAETLQALAPDLPRVSIVNPKRSVDFARSLGLRDKNDRIDAAILALFGATYRPKPSPARPEAYRRLRELSRARARLQSQMQALLNNLRDNEDGFVCQSLQRCTAQLRKEIQRLENEARRVIREDASLRRDAALLQSIKGIGFITAWVLLAELGDLRRYSRTEIVAYVGLYAREFRSGKTVYRKPRLVKGGGAPVRKALYNAARSILNSKNNTLKTYADRLAEAGKKPMDCLTAIMRKLLLIARSVLIQGEKYDPQYGQNSSTFPLR
jgi:transposase